MTYTESFPIRFAPSAQEDAIIIGPNIRFTVLTSRLLRLEYSPTASFEDRPSQVFWYRQQPVPDYSMRREDHLVEIETDHLLLSYKPSEAGFSSESLIISLKDSGVVWHYGQEDLLNLKGTARTLDDIDGAVALEEGLVSRSGWYLWDDSRQLLFAPDGWLTPRNEDEGYRDLYFFGYGHDYYACLRDFSKVAGTVPILPRWALGNWWSRYWPYSAEELLTLMGEFRIRKVPLSVCIVDMDWHIVETGNTSSGWTGYTWNRDLFPDPPAFIAELHERGLKTALNLHPAEGIHPHEDQYRKMAALLDVNPTSVAPIPFDIGDPRFTKAYFEQLHHPYEEQGIDFWWLDWQQGTVTGLPGLDPLWWLNHLHYYDLARDGHKRPFIFSRWGGLGNHRYPIGFSGDTHVTWDSLAFQPYFTATAANVNYGWWSHDIGGHMDGVEDPELYVRWVQFGVFSPIIRLHSTNNPYHERRPWGYDAESERVASDALRLRHALIPYLQTMAWRNHTEGIPLVRSMYYDHPQNEQAYHCPDQYLFGSEIVAAPFTSPADPDTRLSRQVIWLPSGDWFDFFNGDRVSGDGWHAIYGGLDDIPVFAKAGAIIPLAIESIAGGSGTQEQYSIHIFPGDSGTFDLFDGDDSLSSNITAISHYWRGHEWLVRIDPPRGDDNFLPDTRSYEISFRGVHPDAIITAESENGLLEFNAEYNLKTKSLIIQTISVPVRNHVALSLRTEASSLLAADNRLMNAGRKMLQAFRLNTNIKLKLASQLSQMQDDPVLLAAYQLSLTSSQFQALAELLTGSGVQKLDRRNGTGEEIILWNNHSNDSVRQIFAAVELNGLAESSSGPLPKFAVLTIEVKTLAYHVGMQPARGRITVNDWFASLLDRIPRNQVAGVDAVIQFDIMGVNGCSKTLVIDQGNLFLHEGTHVQPAVIITAASNDWLSLINGDQTPEEMFLSGIFRVGGNLELITGLVDAFRLSPPGIYKGDKWRLDINYLDGLTLHLGTG